MADVADKLDGIVDDLAGLEYGLKLGALVLVYEVFVEVQAGGGQQGAGIVVEIGG